MNLIKISIIIVHIFLLFLIWQIRRSWCSPSGWYNIWSFLLIIPSLFIYEHDWKFIGIFWWQLSCFCCLFGHIIGVKNRIKIISFKNELLSKYISYKMLLIIYFIFGVSYIFLLLHIHGFSVASLFSLNGLFQLNNHLQAYRYSKSDINENWFQQICLSFTYALPICGGFMLPDMKTVRGKFICLFLFFPNLFITLVNNTKAGMIIAIILFCSGYVIRYCEKYNTTPSVNKKTIIRFLLLFLCFILLMIITMKLRYNSSIERSNTWYILYLLKDYIYGCVINFDENFFSNNLKLIENSNILTGNYFWIRKYGIINTLIIWFVLGLFSGSAYSNLYRRKSNLHEKLILIFVYLNSIYFFTYLAFSYTTVCVGCFIIYPLFMFCYRDNLTLKLSEKGCYI